MMVRGNPEAALHGMQAWRLLLKTFRRGIHVFTGFPTALLYTRQDLYKARPKRKELLAYLQTGLAPNPVSDHASQLDLIVKVLGEHQAIVGEVVVLPHLRRPPRRHPYQHRRVRVAHRPLVGERRALVRRRPLVEVCPRYKRTLILRFVVEYVVGPRVVFPLDDAALAHFLAVALDGLFGFAHGDYADDQEVVVTPVQGAADWAARRAVFPDGVPHAVSPVFRGLLGCALEDGEFGRVAVARWKNVVRARAVRSFPELLGLLAACVVAFLGRVVLFGRRQVLVR